MKVMDWLLRWNPLAARYMFPQIRTRKLDIGLALYAATLAVFVTVDRVWKGEDVLFLRFFPMCLMLLVVLLWIFAPYASGTALSDERRDRALDFFRMLPLTPREKALGLLVGRNAAVLVLAAVHLVVVVVSGLANGYRPLLVFDLVGFVLCTGLVLMLVSVLSATFELHRTGAYGPLGWILVAVFLIPFLTGFLNAFLEETGDGRVYAGILTGSFYGLPARQLALATIAAVFFCAWCWIGLLRRFRLEREPLLTPVGVVAFVSSYCVLLAGLFWNILRASGTDAMYLLLGFWVLSAFPVLLVPFGSARSHEDYVERALPRGGTPGFRLLQANPVSWLAADVVWWLALYVALRLVRAPAPAMAAAGLVSFGVVLHLLVEAAIVWTPLTPRIRHVAIFAAALYVVLPLLQGEKWFSPLGYLVALVDAFAQGTPWSALPAAARIWAPLSNALLIVLLAWGITVRYVRIGKTGMESL